MKEELESLFEEEPFGDEKMQCSINKITGNNGKGCVEVSIYGENVNICAYGDYECPFQEDKKYMGLEISFCHWEDFWKDIIYEHEKMILKVNNSCMPEEFNY